MAMYFEEILKIISDFEEHIGIRMGINMKDVGKMMLKLDMGY